MTQAEQMESALGTTCGAMKYYLEEQWNGYLTLFFETVRDEESGATIARLRDKDIAILFAAAPDLRDEVIALRAQVERQKCTTDDLLWQEIYSLREKLKIAVAAIKSYEPDFDDQEFTHRLGAVDYDQLMEELSKPPQIESEEA